MAPVSFKQLQSLVGEARRNPEQNPKVPINQRIKQHLENAEMLSDANVPNSFVSFTSIDKLGINPGSRYDTPLGIYSYPSYYIMDEIGDSGSMSDLPFAGRSEFANVFSAKGTILNLNTISSGGLSKLYERITDMYIRHMGYRKGTAEWKEAVDFLEMEVFDAATTYAKFKTNGGLFWWVTMQMADIMLGNHEEMDGAVDRWNVRNHPVSWNKIFREIGIDGCIDGDGEGIIHTAEKTQAVFFSKRAIKENNRYYNKYAPDEVADSQMKGEIEKEKKAEEKKKIAYVMSKVDELKNQSPEEMLDFIRLNRQTFSPINSSVGKKLMGQIDSIEFKKQIIINNIETHHFTHNIRNYIYLSQEVGPTLTEKAVADIANHEFLRLYIGQFPFVINLKENMDLSLIDDKRFQDFRFEYENISDVDDMYEQLNMGNIFSRNINLVIRMIKVSKYQGRGLGQFVEGVLSHNNDLSTGKLFELFDAYVGKLRDNDIPYDILTGDLVSMALGNISTPDFKSVKAQLDDKYGSGEQ